MDKPEQLQVSISIQLSTKEQYSPKTIADISIKQLLNLDSDAAKRKIINELEDLADTCMREASNNIHHSNLLTDGEYKREHAKEE